MKRLVVLASGHGSNLVAIADAISEGSCRATIEAVVSENSNAPVLTRAKERGLRAHCIPFSRNSRLAWEAELSDFVASHSPDLVILAGFMKVLSPTFVARFAGRILNIHPSLLPALGGLHAIRRAHSEAHEFTGVSVHIVDEGVDTGPLLAQARIQIHHGESEDSLRARVQTIEHQLFPLVIECF